MKYTEHSHKTKRKIPPNVMNDEWMDDNFFYFISFCFLTPLELYTNPNEIYTRLSSSLNTLVCYSTQQQVDDPNKRLRIQFAFNVNTRSYVSDIARARLPTPWIMHFMQFRQLVTHYFMHIPGVKSIWKINQCIWKRRAKNNNDKTRVIVGLTTRFCCALLWKH